MAPSPHRGAAAAVRIASAVHPRATPLRTSRSDTRFRPRVKQMLPLLVGGVMVVLLAQKLADVDFAQIRAAFAQISPLAWTVSLVLTLISFRAVAQYDVIAHRLLGTGFPKGRTLASGASATALAQTLGLGLVTGSLVRWRLFRTGPRSAPQDAGDPARAMAVTGLVSSGFLFGWAITTLIAFAFLPTLGGDVSWIGWSVVPVVLALCAASLFAPDFSLFGRRLTVPGLPTLATLVAWAAIDTIAAAGALFVLLPSGTDLSFALLLPAFLLALGCGILSGTPGGFGAFELTLLSMTPAETGPAVLAAIVGFRLTYYLLPAMLAAAHVLWPADKALDPLNDAETPAAPTSCDARAAAVRDIWAAPDPLSALLHQPGTDTLTRADLRGHWMVHRGNQALVALGAPFGDGAADMLRSLEQAGRSAGVPVVVYKAPAATAKRLKKAGWWCLPLGAEAVLRPDQFDISGPAHRQLRRKLRHAGRAGVEITRPPRNALPFGDMASIARRWSEIHGGERGLSMGRYCPDLLGRQRIYMARQDGRPVAFVSFHVTREGWMLDLVRHEDRLPDGTMHSLIHAALRDAAVERVPVLSLDCVPFHAPGARGIIGMIMARAFDKTPGAKGLLQFKNSFGPEWVPRSLAVQGPAGLVLGSFEILKALRPRPMATAPGSAATTRAAHDYHVDYALDA